MNEYLLASPRRLTYVAPVFGPTMLASIADDAQADQRPMKDALVAQLDRALDYESRGREFNLPERAIFLCFLGPDRGFKSVSKRFVLEQEFDTSYLTQ